MERFVISDGVLKASVSLDRKEVMIVELDKLVLRDNNCSASIKTYICFAQKMSSWGQRIVTGRDKKRRNVDQSALIAGMVVAASSKWRTRRSVSLIYAAEMRWTQRHMSFLRNIISYELSFVFVDDNCKLWNLG